MNIGAIVQWVLVGVATIGVTSYILGKAKSIIEEQFAKWRKDIEKQIEIKLQDTEFREMAYKAIIYAQKTFGDLSGGARLSKAIVFAQRLIPGTFDDAIIAGVIQKIYDEIMKPIKEVK